MTLGVEILRFDDKVEQTAMFLDDPVCRVMR